MQLREAFHSDTKMFSTVKILDQASHFHSAIVNAEKWSEDWMLKFNKNKWEHMHYGKSNNFFTYHMGNHLEAISSVEEERAADSASRT